MNIEAFFDSKTWTLTYLVWDPTSKDALIIDPVLDYDAQRVKVTDDSVNKLIARVRELGLTLHYALETHAHADHLTGAHLLRQRTGAKIGAGERIRDVQATFRDVFDLGDSFVPDGHHFDLLAKDGEVFHAGTIAVRTLATPGHTPACVTWQIGDAVFTGDALFMPDQGTGRCDFPKGSADDLYASVQKLYALPDETRVFVGHDYQPGGRELKYQTTIGEEKAQNIQLKAETPRDTYVAWRTARDKTLNLPNLIYPSLFVNIRAGELPEAGAAGVRYLKLPLNLFDGPVPA